MPELVLVPQEGTGAGQVPEGDVTIGREGCDVTLTDPEVSRRHAAFRRLPSGPAVEDLDSRNGTFVNEQRISGVRELREGDVVRVGDARWRLERRGQPATALASAPAAEPRGDVPGPEAPPPAPAAKSEPRGDVPGPEAPPPAVAAGESRGDVPAPEVMPSAIRRIVTTDRPAGPPRFDPAPPGRSKASAARRLEATLVSYAVVLLTAAAVVIYLAER